jgi:hypothetical protein
LGAPAGGNFQYNNEDEDDDDNDANDDVFEWWFEAGLWEGPPKENRLRVGEVVATKGAVDKDEGAALVGAVVALNVMGAVLANVAAVVDVFAAVNGPAHIVVVVVVAVAVAILLYKATSVPTAVAAARVPGVNTVEAYKVQAASIVWLWLPLQPW